MPLLSMGSLKEPKEKRFGVNYQALVKVDQVPGGSQETLTILWTHQKNKEGQ